MNTWTGREGMGESYETLHECICCEVMCVRGGWDEPTGLCNGCFASSHKPSVPVNPPVSLAPSPPRRNWLERLLWGPHE